MSLSRLNNKMGANNLHNVFYVPFISQYTFFSLTKSIYSKIILMYTHTHTYKAKQIRMWLTKKREFSRKKFKEVIHSDIIKSVDLHQQLETLIAIKIEM
ncbi:hypothetical protein EGR_10807 [Echinococcus granulosus]|uniref:Uncharacterized protein n=1 Tax=Echinococcus granulosus TaxID=6210 RepID=W6U7I9_ECHGR|nr:hypothetical protein EGR_10807 [Echinococcus granulosus]EUB54332.1 hypothetical protein EGR_10807 [Echinococcus granulosus]